MTIALRTKAPIRAVMMLIAAIVLATVLTLPSTWTGAHAQTPAAESANPPAAGHRVGRRGEPRVPRPSVAGTVIQGADTVTLVASLPWWRIDGPLAPAPDPGQDESQILTACDFWLGFPYATTDSNSLTVRLASAQHASELESAIDRVLVADPNEVNEIDLEAPAQPPARPWWLGGLLAALGSAAAAGTGYLVVRSRAATNGASLNSTFVPSDEAML